MNEEILVDKNGKKLKYKHPHIKLMKNCSYMIKKEFRFPEYTQKFYSFIRNEIEFTAFVVFNKWIQRRLGIKDIEYSPYFPDIHAKVNIYNIPIRIELEYDAKNFNKHHHPFGMCDLVLCFFANKQITIGGAKVWSFYRWDTKKKEYIWSLDEDIKSD